MSILCASEQNSSYSVEIPSNYITKYIQQRKQLLLAKLQEALMKGTQDQSMKMQNQLQQQPQLKRQIFRQQAKKRVKVYEEIMTPSNSKNTPNKIIEQDFYKKNNNPSKFMLRATLYQQQRQLKRKIQKSKQNYQLFTEHTFSPNISAKNSTQKKARQQKQPINYSYQQKHQQKKIIKPIQNNKTTKSLFKKSTDLFKRLQKPLQKSQLSNETTTNWKRIQQYFAKLTLSPTISLSTKQHLTSLSSKKLLFEQNLLIIKQFQELFENESERDKREEEQIKMFINKLEKQQDQISVIAVEEQKKQDLDASNIIENVVKSMHFEGQKQQCKKEQVYTPQFIEQIKYIEEKQINISDYPAQTKQKHQTSFKLSFEDTPVSEKQAQQVVIVDLKTEQNIFTQKKQQENRLSKFLQENEVLKVQSKIMDNNSHSSEQINIQIQQSFCKQFDLHKLNQNEVSNIEALNELIEAENNPIPQILYSVQSDSIRKTHKEIIPEEDKSIQFEQEGIRVTLVALADQFMRCSVNMIGNQPYDQSESSQQHWEDEDIFTKQEQYTVSSISNMDFSQFSPPKHIAELMFTLQKQIQKPLQPPPLLSRQQFEDEDSPPQLRMDKQSVMSSVRDFGQCYYLVIPEQQYQESMPE